MFVGSLAEMHLTAYGWMLYDSLWGLFAFVGLTVFPFTWILFNGIFDAVKKHGIASPVASEAAFHAVFPSFVLMMGIYSIACLPTIPLNIQTWEYSEICSTPDTVQELERLQLGSTGTSLDLINITRGSMVPADAKVPILWDIVMRIGSGVGRALNTGGSCINNLSYIDKNLREMRIEDQPLRAELAQFTADCFVPAKNRYNRALQQGNLNTVPTVNDAVNPDQYFAAQYRDWRDSPPLNRENDEILSREEDANYVGSRFFLNTPGLYAPAVPGQFHLQVDTLKATVPIAGWSYDPFRDCQHNNAAAGDFCTNPSRNSDLANNYGSPTCDEWWKGSGSILGLQEKLRRSAEGSFKYQGMSPSDVLNATIAETQGPEFSKTDAWLADKIVSTALANDEVTQQSVKDVLVDAYSSAKNTVASLAVGKFLTGIFSSAQGAAVAGPVAANLAINAVDFYSTSWIVRQSYPIMQAYLMLFFIAMLPIMLVGSIFDVGRLLQFLMIFLAIQFLSPWRFIVEYLDSQLFEIMYPDATSWGTAVSMTPERILVDVTTTAMYGVFPLVLLWLVSMAGADGAQSAKAAFNSESLSRMSSSSIRALAGLIKR